MLQRLLCILILVTGQHMLCAAQWPQLEKTEGQECPEGMAEAIFHGAGLVFHSSSENVCSISKTQLNSDLKLLLEATDGTSHLNVCD
jgi:hypothetical protein